MKNFNKDERYKIGTLSKRGNINPKKPEYSAQPIVVYGNELIAQGVKNTMDFFRKNPLGLPTNKVYHIYIVEEDGSENYFDQGTATAPNLSTGLGELPSVTQPRNKLNQDENAAIKEQQRSTNHALTILENELQAKNAMIASLQEQLITMSRAHAAQINELNQDLSIEKARLANATAELDKERKLKTHIERIEEKLEKDHDKLLSEKARKMAQSSGMGSLAELMPLAQMFLPIILGNQQQPQPAPVPVPVPPPPAQEQPAQPLPQTNVQLNPAQWGQNGSGTQPSK